MSKFWVPRTQLRDPDTDHIKRIIAERYERIVGPTYDDLLIKIWEQVPRDKIGKGKVSGELAASYLEACIVFLEEAARRVVDELSSAHWLWLLRRTPREIFEGSLRSTLVYDQALAEVLTENSTCLESRFKMTTGGASWRFEVNTATIDTLLRLICIARMISGYHSRYRRCGKGASLRLRPRRRPEIETPKDIESAIKIFDQVMEGQTVSAYSGTSLLSQGVSLSDPYTLLGASRSRHVRSAQVTIPAEVSGILGGVTANVIAEWNPVLINLVELTRLDQSRLGGWWQAEVPALLLLLRASSLILAELDGFLAGIYRVGYGLSERERFVDALDRSMGEISDEIDNLIPGATIGSSLEVLATVSSVRGTTWPLIPGSWVRTQSNFLAIDIVAGSEALHRYLVIAPGHSGGDRVNERAKHFEKTVQATIDGSAWRPSARIGELQSKSLRYNGRVITDIDAVGELGGTLLLASVKSYPITPDYSRGSYTAIRNVRTKVEEAVADWHEKMEHFKAFPKGDNYDFRRYTEIIGPVVLPFMPYVDITHATKYIQAGLRSISSLDEFGAWCRGGGR